MRAMVTAWCLGLVLALVAPGGVGAQTWLDVRPEGGRYRILMPQSPRITVEPVRLRDGRTVHMVQAVAEISLAAYLSSHVDYPPDVMRSQTPEGFLDNVMNGSAAGHTLIRQRPLTIGGHPAREYVILRANGFVLVTRSVAVGDRLYQIIVARGSGGPEHPDTHRFLESFVLESSAPPVASPSPPSPAPPPPGRQPGGSDACRLYPNLC